MRLTQTVQMFEERQRLQSRFPMPPYMRSGHSHPAAGVGGEDMRGHPVLQPPPPPRSRSYSDADAYPAPASTKLGKTPSALSALSIPEQEDVSHSHHDDGDEGNDETGNDDVEDGVPKIYSDVQLCVPAPVKPKERLPLLDVSSPSQSMMDTEADGESLFSFTEQEVGDVPHGADVALAEAASGTSSSHIDSPSTEGSLGGGAGGASLSSYGAGPGHHNSLSKLIEQKEPDQPSRRGRSYSVGDHGHVEQSDEYLQGLVRELEEAWKLRDLEIQQQAQIPSRRHSCGALPPTHPPVLGSGNGSVQDTASAHQVGISPTGSAQGDGGDDECDCGWLFVRSGESEGEVSMVRCCCCLHWFIGGETSPASQKLLDAPLTSVKSITFDASTWSSFSKVSGEALCLPGLQLKGGVSQAATDVASKLGVAAPTLDAAAVADSCSAMQSLPDRTKVASLSDSLCRAEHEFWDAVTDALYAYVHAPFLIFVNNCCFTEPEVGSPLCKAVCFSCTHYFWSL